MSAEQNQQDSKSYLKINYSLRPAKSAERKMLCEGFRRLSKINKIECYKYIGFGSTYFSDFSLFHKALGINSMLSIEENQDDKSRFEFNKPYKCIDLIFGASNEVLPKLEWKIPTILWLDYDDQLSSSVLGDIGVFCAKVLPGSMFVVTVNAQPDSLDHCSLTQPYDWEKKLNEHRIQKLTELVGEDRIPPGIEGKDLNLRNKVAVLWEIINNEVLEILAKRNGGNATENKVEYKQVFNFTYQDGAKMLTVGGVLLNLNQVNIFKNSGFEGLDFYKPGSDSFTIDIPKLTFREIRSLDKLLPSRDPNGEIVSLTQDQLGVELSSIPEGDIEKYIKIYRYFPNFAETEL